MTQKLEHVAPTELRTGFCDETINIALLTELNDEEPSFEPLPSALQDPLDPAKLPAGITDPGYNGVLNQQKTAQITRDVATRETNSVLLVGFCSAL